MNARSTLARSATLKRESTPDAEEKFCALPEAGALIDGRYCILEKLGEGGMGAVYRVEHVRMGKIMALKLLRPDLASSREGKARFEREAQIVSRLSHVNTVSVFDFGELADKSLYMAMEFVPGVDLASVLESEGSLSERRTIEIAIQVLRSLAEAHDAGIVHRDIKPANIMLLKSKDGSDLVKVVDFGIAKPTVASGVKRRITGFTAFIGTPDYASPEQARGDELDARSDLYSLAATLFELLTGHPPFGGSSPMDVLSRHLCEPPPHVRDAAPEARLSEGIDEVIAKALSKRPGDRHQSADEMRLAFEALLAPRAARPRAVVPREAATVDLKIARRTDWDQFERQLRRGATLRRALGIVVALLVLGGAVALLAAIHRSAQPPAPQRPQREEREPNNDFDQATLIVVGENIKGTIGRRLSELMSDRDYYRFRIDGDRPRRARIAVTAVPNVNVSFQLFAEHGRAGRAAPVEKALANVDDQPTGSAQPEMMDDLLLPPGTYFVVVGDKRRASEETVLRPRENSSDPYLLTVELADPDPLDEREPDNTVEDAATYGPRGSDQPVLGHAGGFAPRETQGGAAAMWSDDHYQFKLSPGATHACALITGLPAARLWLAVGEQPGAFDGAPVIVEPNAVGKLCVAAASALWVHVGISAGADYDVPYALVVIDDGAAGNRAARVAAQRLSDGGRSALASDLVAQAHIEVAGRRATHRKLAATVARASN